MWRRREIVVTSLVAVDVLFFLALAFVCDEARAAPLGARILVYMLVAGVWATRVVQCVVALRTRRMQTPMTAVSAAAVYSGVVVIVVLLDDDALRQQRRVALLVSWALLFVVNLVYARCCVIVVAEPPAIARKDESVEEDIFDAMPPQRKERVANAIKR